jgi:hypothetical protein
MFSFFVVCNNSPAAVNLTYDCIKIDIAEKESFMMNFGNSLIEEARVTAEYILKEEKDDAN